MFLFLSDAEIVLHLIPLKINSISLELRDTSPRGAT